MRRLALALLPAIASAVEVEAAKLATADAMPIAAGSYELALGATWTNGRSTFAEDGGVVDRGGTLIERQFSLGLTAGLADDLDTTITLGWARIDDGAADPGRGDGPTDAAICVRWRFLNDNGVALALIPGVSLPVGDGRPTKDICTGSNLWGADLALAATAAFDRLALGAAIDGSWLTGKDKDRGDARGCVATDLAIGWQLTDAIQPEIELHFHRDLNAGDTPDAWFLTATAGILVGTEYGRFGAGFDHTLAGRNADRSSSVLLQWVKGF